MVDYYGTFNGNSNYRLRLSYWLAGQSVAGNYSNISWNIVVEKLAGSGYWTYSGGNGWSLGGSISASGGWAPYDFRNYSALLIGSGTSQVNHNPDGTCTVSLSATANDNAGGNFGSATAAGSLVLPTIPRATQPTVSPPSGDTNDAYTITHVAAVSTFYHDVDYSVDGGSSWTSIESDLPGTDTSTQWTPPHSLFPNSTSGTAIVRVTTRSSSGGSVLGSKTASISLAVPSGVVPTVASPGTASDGQDSPDMATLMGGAGRFVQRWSRPLMTPVTQGAGGSTITGTTITIGSQTTTPGVAVPTPISGSGQVPFNIVTTDSRGRNSVPYSNTLTVAPYNWPTLGTPTVNRTGDGTSLTVSPTAATSDLTFGGTQKNLIQWRIRTWPANDPGNITVEHDWNDDGTNKTGGVFPAGVNPTWATPVVLTGYSLQSEWIVETSIRDLFNPYSSQATVVRTIRVPTEEVFMDWDGNDGIGIGKYRQNGKLDVAGDIYGEILYQNGVRAVDLSNLSTTTAAGIVELATNAETQAGADATRAVTPAGLASLTATDTRRGLVELATEGEVRDLLSDELAVTPLALNMATEQSIIMRPSSITVGSGTASVDADGVIHMVGVNSFFIYDVFSPDYSHYTIYISQYATANSDNVAFRFLSGGGQALGGYYQAGWHTNPALTLYSVVNESYAKLRQQVGQTYHVIDVYNPAVATVTHCWIKSINSGANIVLNTNMQRAAATVYDGFHMNPQAGTLDVDMTIVARARNVYQ